MFVCVRGCANVLIFLDCFSRCAALDLQEFSQVAGSIEGREYAT